MRDLISMLTCVYSATQCLHITVNPLLSPPGGLFFPSTFEGGGGGLKERGGLLFEVTNKYFRSSCFQQVGTACFLWNC